MHAARIGLEDSEPAAVGAAVTVALCGHWEHEPPCPLAPHHTSASPDGGVVQVRTIFVAEPRLEGWSAVASKPAFAKASKSALTGSERRGS